LPIRSSGLRSIITLTSGLSRSSSLSERSKKLKKTLLRSAYPVGSEMGRMRIGNRWTVYILRCADGSFYTGITRDLSARVEAHNSGRGAKYTRSRRPVRAVFWESVDGHGAALRREQAIKKLRRSKKEEFVKRFGVGEDG